MELTEGLRGDGRWTLRLMLSEQLLRPVFAALCDDIASSTRSGVADAVLGSAIVRRLIHWRTLMEKDGGGLGEEILRGLIGELIILRDKVMPVYPLRDAVRCWTGPRGTPQDFQLPDGRRWEVKAVARRATQARINGLGQLDAGTMPLVLVVVRVEATGIHAAGALTAPLLIADLRQRLEADPEGFAALNENLAEIGWHEHPGHDEVVVRVCAIEEHTVTAGFPRLTSATVPPGILDASYLIELPAPGAASRDGRS